MIVKFVGYWDIPKSNVRNETLDDMYWPLFNIEANTKWCGEYLISDIGYYNVRYPKIRIPAEALTFNNSSFVIGM